MTDMRTPESGYDSDPTIIRDPDAPAELSGGPEGTLPVVATPEVIPTDHQLPESTSPSHEAMSGGAPDPEMARREISETRSRMSDTIDQIEEQLLRRKERLQAQLDVRGQLRERLSPVREVIERQPLAVFGGVLGLGLLLGYLTGGGDSGSADGMEMDAHGGWHRKARRWEARSRELMRINAELEEEVRRLRQDLDGEMEDEGGWMTGLGRAIGSMFGRSGATEVETIVELEEDELPGDYHPSASYDEFSQGQRIREPEDPLQG